MDAKTLVLNVRGGFRIVVPADLGAISTYVFLEQEDWFEDEAELVRRLARPGFRMLDIGANVGFYSLAAAAASGGEARIARSLGQTPRAARLAGQVADGAIRGARLDIDEAFPVLLPIYETWTAPGGMGAWIGAMAIESWWMWNAFSDCFRTEAFPFAHPATLLESCGRRAPAFERRRQLARMRAGEQSGPVAAEILFRRGRGNLNSAYWTGDPAEIGS
jgi:hypothetical protein